MPPPPSLQKTKIPQKIRKDYFVSAQFESIRNHNQNILWNLLAGCDVDVVVVEEGDVVGPLYLSPSPFEDVTD